MATEMEFSRQRTLRKGIAVNPSVFRSQIGLLAVMLVTPWTGLFCGCQPHREATRTEDPQNPGVTAMAGPDAREIVQSLRDAYASATGYQDQAKLELSYQLQGSHLEEPHPWKVEFIRGQGLKVDVYGARLKADKKDLACFVFDFASGNLDDQWLVIPRNESLPISRLFQDGICRHYLTGQEDLPIHETHPLAGEAFFPPTLGLLTGQPHVHWLEEGQGTRLADDTVEGRSCFQVQWNHAEMTWTLWVDQQDYLIRQIRYPVELLDARLQNNPDVQNLEVLAKFKSAAWQVAADAVRDQMVFPEDARQVTQFVPVPETFPSSFVGKEIGPLGLRNAADQIVDQSDWLGKVTLLCWANQADDPATMRQALQEIADDLPVKEYSIYLVEIINGVLPGNPLVTQKLTELSQSSKLPLLADYNFSSGRALGLQSYPVVAIVDRQGVLQYVKKLTDDPNQAGELAKVLVRIRSGDNVAAEMRAEYESFLNLYQERLTAALIHAANGRDDGKLIDESPPTHMQVRNLWTNDQVQQPGNLRFRESAAEPAFTLLDGWRTVIHLDLAGRQTLRQELELGHQESISIVRQGDQQPQLSVLFSVMGRAVRIVDADLKLLHTLETESDQQRIRDANLFDFDNDGVDELLVSFTGPRGTELVKFQGEPGTRKISNQSFRSATVFPRPQGGKRLVFCDGEAKIRVVDSGSDVAREVTCDLLAATRIVSQQDHQGDTLLCALGTNPQGQWTAIGLDAELNQVWSVAVGTQRFDTQMESIVYAQLPTRRGGMWAIAAADGSVKLVSDDGKRIDDWRMGLPIHGIEMVATEQAYLLVVSTDHRVQAWELTAGATATLPASAGR